MENSTNHMILKYYLLLRVQSGRRREGTDNLVSTNYWSICHNMSLIAFTNMSIIESLLSTSTAERELKL